MKGTHESSKNEFEPEELNQIETDLQQRTHQGGRIDQRWVLRDLEVALYLIVPEEQHGHEDNAGTDVANEENEVHKQEGKPLGLLVLEHAPSLVHTEGSPLTDEVACG